MQAARQMKPGLGQLLVSECSPDVLAKCASAVSAALALSGIACVPVLADKPRKDYVHHPRPSGASPNLAIRSTDVPRSFWALVTPQNLAVILTKNVGLHLLLKLSVYMAELSDYEYKRMVADEQGTLPPDPPKLMSVEDAAQVGVYYSLRELATSFVKTAYEHLFYWKLGPERSQPFLRNGPVWVVQVLRPKHADSPVSKKVFSYSMALLHSQALFYAAECTVAISIGATNVVRDKTTRPQTKAKVITKIVIYQVFRCSLLLASTSFVAAIGTLAKPGFGTRAGLLLTDQGVSIGLQPLAQLAIAP